MLSCFTCVPAHPGVADSVVVRQEGKSKASKRQGPKKAPVVLLSTDGAKVQQELSEPASKGRLKLKTGSVVYVWQKVRVVIEDGHLMIFEKADKKVASKMLPLQLCNVKPISRRRFKVFCAPNTHLELKAVDNDAVRGWVTVIQDGVIRQLSLQSEDSASGMSKGPSGMDLLAALRKGHESNKFCADCNAPDPKWISVSIGCIICIECSGVHRQLGVTISKIRSFELDKWSERTEMVEKIGNVDVNNALEIRVPHHKKPSAKSDREAREVYIYDKYVRKIFSRRPGSTLEHFVSWPQPGHKRDGSKPSIHIGANPFDAQNAKHDFARRGSLFEFGHRRGSDPFKLRSPRPIKRRHSLHPQL